MKLQDCKSVACNSQCKLLHVDCRPWRLFPVACLPGKLSMGCVWSLHLMVERQLCPRSKMLWIISKFPVKFQVHGYWILLWHRHGSFFSSVWVGLHLISFIFPTPLTYLCYNLINHTKATQYRKNFLRNSGPWELLPWHTTQLHIFLCSLLGNLLLLPRCIVVDTTNPRVSSGCWYK